MRILVLLCLLLSTPLAVATENTFQYNHIHYQKTFQNAKRILKWEETVMGDRYNNCGLFTNTTGQLTCQALNSADHVFPAARYYRTLPCGAHANPRTKCAQDPRFVKYESDLHNLFYTTVATNNKKSDYPWCKSPAFFKEPEELRIRMTVTRIPGGVEMRCVIPPRHFKGDIARIGLYLAEEYQLPFTDEERWVMDQWADEDPVSQDERDRNDWIFEVQGNRNPYVE